MSELILDPDIDNNQEFIDYKEELESFPYYTPLTPEERERYEEMDALPAMPLRKARQHPYLWAKWVVGVKPRDYQWKLLDMMKRSKRLGAVTSRQVGKSFCIAIFAFWAAYNSVTPRKIDDKTKIGIVSRTEDQAKKLLNDIVNIIERANNTYMKLARNNKIPGYNNYFTEKYAKKPSKSKLEWSRGIIEVFPPTDSVLGESLSFLIIDEADKLKTVDDLYYFWESSAMPTVKETQGAFFAFSTPKGVPTPFYDVINPEEGNPMKGWQRIWYPWTINVEGWAYGWAERAKYIANGREIFFATEYEASFKSGAFSFFHPDRIDDCINRGRGAIMECNQPVYVGIDFSGGGECRTAVSFAYFDTQEEKSVVLYSKEFPQGYQNDKLVTFLKEFRNRYNIKNIVAEKCPAGETPIALMKRAGFRVIEFNSRADKINAYMNLEIAINNGSVELYNNKELLSQLKGLESKETAMGNIQIRKSKGMLDDVADSMMFAVSEFVKPKRKGKRFIL